MTPQTRNILALVALAIFLAACSNSPHDARHDSRQPDIYPDYRDVTIPDGIAPLNFAMSHATDYDRIDVMIRGERGGELKANGAETAEIDIDDWHSLTHQNRGAALKVTVSTRSGGQWTQWADFNINVSSDTLDAWGLTYRRVAPGYESYSHMGIYQRKLADFTEESLFDNRLVPGACVNCHASVGTDPDKAFTFHIRGDHGATLMNTGGKQELLAATNDVLGGSMVYPHWEASGRYCAFSTNKTRQAFHVGPPHPIDDKRMGHKRIEVFDMESDIFVYEPATHKIIMDSIVSKPDWSENTPVFSPDGRWIYFITCLQQDYPLHFQDEKYNLCRIGFDGESQSFAQTVDTLFDAVAQGKSVTWPRPSYDGRFLLFTLSDYGYFSIWHEESDQWLLDLSTMEARPLDNVNSPRADSYHNWSRDSRWIVFTSRRDDGLYSRLYIAHIDSEGNASKPFMLPQKNPRQYYDASLYSFNTPDFTLHPVSLDAHATAQQILAPERR